MANDKTTEAESSSTDLKDLLAVTATNAERVKGLLQMGLSPAVLATATRSSPSTIRNWSLGTTQPRADAAIALDDLRMVARALLDAVKPERAARWLTSRDPAQFDGKRPVEMVPVDPMKVLAAAKGLSLR